MRGSTVISTQNVDLFGTSISGTLTVPGVSVPPSTFSHTDVIAAGTYTYKVQMYINSATGTGGAEYTKLLAYEL